MVIGIIALVVHLTLQISGVGPSASTGVGVIIMMVLVVVYGAWLIVTVVPAWVRTLQERGDALDRRTPGQDTWLLLTVRRGLRLTRYRPARVALNESGLTLTQTSGEPVTHQWSDFTDVVVQQSRVLRTWRPTFVLRGPGLTIVAIPWVLGGWPSTEEVARQAADLQGRIASAHRSGA